MLWWISELIFYSWKKWTILKYVNLIIELGVLTSLPMLLGSLASIYKVPEPHSTNTISFCTDGKIYTWDFFLISAVWSFCLIKKCWAHKNSAIIFHAKKIIYDVWLFHIPPPKKKDIWKGHFANCYLYKIQFCQLKLGRIMHTKCCLQPIQK